MAFTTAQLAVLENAIATGSLEVTYDGKTIKYASFDDLKRRYEYVREQLAAGGAVPNPRVGTSVTSFSKG